jgi:hypothetical protein
VTAHGAARRGAALLLALATTTVARAQNEPLAVVEALISGADLQAIDAPLPAELQPLGSGLRYLRDYLQGGERRRVEQALHVFSQATARGRSPWPHYLLARTFLLLERRELPVINSRGKREGERYDEGMWRQLREVVRDHPGFAPTRALALDVMVAGGDRELSPAMREIVEREIQQEDATADGFLVHGRDERTRHRYAEALVAFREAGRRGGDPSVLGLEEARTLLATGDSADAEARYWSGVEQPTDDGVALYRADLAWMVAEDSLAAFDAAAREGHLIAWLQRFWARRDAASTTPPGGRLREHLRRWVVAHERFRVPKPWTREMYTRFWFVSGGRPCVRSDTEFVDSLPLHPPTLSGDIREAEPLLDHRGFVYLRHGTPATTLTPPGAGGETVIDLAWIYWVDGRWRIFSFGGSSTFGHHAPTTLLGYLPLSEQAWLALGQALPEYQRAATRVAFYNGKEPLSCLPDVRDAITRQREDATVALTTDSHSPVITAPWNAAIRTFALGTGVSGDARALVTWAVPTRDLVADTLADGRLLWRIRTEVTAFRPRDGAQVRVDSTRWITGAIPPEDANLTADFEIPLSPGAWEVTVSLRQPGARVRAAALAQELLVSSGEGLALSDLLPGRAGGHPWAAGDGTFPIHILGTWLEGETVELYFEVAGAVPGREYQTTIEVLPLYPRRGESVAVTTTSRMTGADTPVRRSIDLGRLGAGVYQLAVTVEAEGTAVRRQQEILVLRP